MIMANDNNIQSMADDSQIVLYQPDGSIRLEVKLDQDTVWLNCQQMAQLFGRDARRKKDFVGRLVMKFRYYVWDMYFLYWVIALLSVVLIGWYLCRLLLEKI